MGRWRCGCLGCQLRRDALDRNRSRGKQRVRDMYEAKALKITLRRVPRHHWVRLIVGSEIEPSHAWQYAHMVRRDTFTLRGIGLVVMRCPKASA